MRSCRAAPEKEPISMTRTNASMADKRFIVILRQNELYVEIRPISMIAEWAKMPQRRFGPRSPITHVAEHTDEGTQARRRSRGLLGFPPPVLCAPVERLLDRLRADPKSC